MTRQFHQLHLRRATGFTLIELLAVVAVIAILLSLLLPAIAQSRYRAQASVCIANMKQFGIANGSYMGDWGGARSREPSRFPPAAPGWPARPPTQASNTASK